MLSFLLSLIPALNIPAALNRAYKDKLTATNDAERLAVEERIAALQAQQIAQKPIDALMRIAFAAPIAAYYGKIFLWDKVLGWGSTDPLSSNLTYVAMVVIGFYFLHSMVKRA